MGKLKLSRKELVIIDLLIIILVIKFAYEPFVKNVTSNVQINIDKILLFMWFIIGIVLLTFCFTNLFSAIQIFFKRRKIDKKSEEYINKTQEYYIKLNNAKYFGKIFLFIYLLFNSLFIMGIIFLIYNFVLSILDIHKLKYINSSEKEYNETIYKINSEIQNMSLYSIIINMSYFYLQYNSIIFKYVPNNAKMLKIFIFGIAFIIIQMLVYFIFIRKIIFTSNKLKKISSKLIINLIYIISSFVLINVLLYFLRHLL